MPLDEDESDIDIEIDSPNVPFTSNKKIPVKDIRAIS